MNRRSVVIGIAVVILVGLVVMLMRGRAPSGGQAKVAEPAGSVAPGAGSGAGTATAGAAAGVGDIAMSLRTGTVGATLYRFDASGSRDAQGNPLRRFRFDFGDGDQENSTTGQVEHPFDYEYAKEAPMVAYEVVVTGYDAAGKSGEIRYKVEIDNAVGQELREGRLLIEGDRCVMAFSPESQSWFCSATIRNTHAEAVRFETVTLFYEPSGHGMSPELQKAMAEPRKLRELGIIEQRAAQPVFPAELAANATAEITIEVGDKKIEGGTLAGVSITASGKGATSGKPARAIIRTTLGTRRTWMSEEEVKRAGLPPPPHSLDMPTPMATAAAGSAPTPPSATP